MSVVEQWNSVEREPPPENVVVDTMSPGGIRQTLKRVKNLWLVPDGSIYVYYTPILWLPLLEKRATKPG